MHYHWWMDQENVVCVCIVYTIYIYTMEFYSAIRKNDTMWVEGKWMQLEDIILSEVNQVQKDKGRIFSLICERQIQKINIYTKQTWSYTNSDVGHVCNSRTTVWTRGGGKGEENARVSTISKCITSVQVEDVRMCIGNYWIMGGGKEGVRE
jgi:hypothetical protein